jgi:hypothetical protein
VLVPSSRNKPHQSLPQHVYFERMDDSFKPIGHAGVDLYFRARHFREFGSMPLIFLSPESNPLMTHREFTLTLVNWGNSPALNLSLEVGPCHLSSRGVLGVNAAWQLSLASSDPPKDEWENALRCVRVMVENPVFLTVAYQDVAGSSYKLSARVTYDEGPIPRVRVHRQVALERDGVKIVG